MLSEVRTAEFVNGGTLWLDEYVYPRLQNVEELEIRAGTSGSKNHSPCDLLRSTKSDERLFPALRTLTLERLDLGHGVVDELCELLRSRSEPTGEITVVLEHCYNASRSEVAKLATFVTVQEEPSGNSDAAESL